MPKHLTGAKFSSSHTTVTDAAHTVAVFLVKLPEVKKIVLGKIVSARSNTAQFKVKVIDEDNQLRLTVRGTNSVQTLYVITTDRARVRQLIEAEYPAS